MLKISGFSKTYVSGKKAVNGLSLEVNPGEIYAFIGHNGAGKTTTLRAVAGILPFEDGEIYVNGYSIKANPIEAKASMAFLPDNPDMYEFMSGIKYLAFIADLYGIDTRTRNERIEMYASAFGIADVLGNAIGSFSHGMKQKLALVSAFMRKPKLLLLDEPFVGLDPTASHLLKTMLRELCNEGGAVLYSTHVLEVAQKLCDRVAILKDGQLIKEGDMQSVVGDKSLEDVFLTLGEKEGDL